MAKKETIPYITTWRIESHLGYVVNNHGDRFSPRFLFRCSPSKWPKWVINEGYSTNYLLTGMILQVTGWMGEVDGQTCREGSDQIPKAKTWDFIQVCGIKTPWHGRCFLGKADMYRYLLTSFGKKVKKLTRKVDYLVSGF